MAELGCPLWQGYLFGQPMPVHRLGTPVIPAQPRSGRSAHLAS